MVKNAKNHMKKDLPDSMVNISRSISTFLSAYQKSTIQLLNKSPADLLLTQAPETRLSLISPNVFQIVKGQLQPKPRQHESKRHQFGVGDIVLVREFIPDLHDKMAEKNDNCST